MTSASGFQLLFLDTYLYLFSSFQSFLFQINMCFSCIHYPWIILGSLSVLLCAWAISSWQESWENVAVKCSRMLCNNHALMQYKNTPIEYSCLMVNNSTFNNISPISWQSVLLLQETWGPLENHRPVASHWQTLYKWYNWKIVESGIITP